MAKINVGARVKKPSHHLKLVGPASNEVGLICVGPGGKHIPGVVVSPYPPSASRIAEGRSKHSDKNPPFTDIALQDFSGGFGVLHHDEDESKYLEGYMMATSQLGRPSLQGRPTYTKGLREFNEYQPATSVLMSWRQAYGATNPDTVVSFTTSAAGYNADKAILYLRKVGTPTGNVTVTLISGADTVEQTVVLAATDLPYHSPYYVEFDWTGVEALAGSTAYKININYEGGDASNRIEIFYDATNGKFPYRVLDDTAPFTLRMFEYRGAIYGVTQPADRSNSKLYLLGYRGLADSNTGALTTTLDGTNQFTVDELIGYEVRIMGGPGSQEVQTWRTITDNEIGSVTHATWTIEHTADTEYIITDDTWRLINALDFYCTDVAVTDRVLYLAAGPDDYLHRMRFGNNDQTWTFEGEIGVSEVAEEFHASVLCAIPHKNIHGRRKTYDLFTARNNNYVGDKIFPNSITKYNTPPFWGSPYMAIGQLTDHRSWVAEEVDNVIQSSDRMWARLDVAESFVTGVLCSKEFNPIIDISDAEIIATGIYTSVNMAEGDLKLRILDAKDNSIELNFPAILAEDDSHDDFKWVEIDLHTLDNAPTPGYVDLSRVKKISLVLNADKGAQVIKLGKSGIWAIARPDGAGQYALAFGERVNNLIEYGGSAGQVVRKPWVGTSRNVYYIEGDHLLPIYVREIEELEDERNCEMMGVNDVYVYFNVGKKVQRYYAGQLDNIGPEVLYPLPSGRAGYPCTFASYPGRAVVGYDSSAAGFSWVGYRRNHGWHELYRSPVTGQRIREIHSYARLSTLDQLFISEGSDVLYVPLSTGPEQEASFPYANHGHIQTSRIYGSLRETKNYYHALEIIQEAHAKASTGDFSASVKAFYRTNNLAEWTELGDFDAVPNKEIKIGSNDVGGNWIQFLLEFETLKAIYSPIMVVAVLDAVERTLIKNQYSYRIITREGKSKGKFGSTDALTGVQVVDQLNSWVNQELPLTLNSNSAYEDGKIVFIEPSTFRMVHHDIEMPAGTEVRHFDLTLIEVE